MYMNYIYEEILQQLDILSQVDDMKVCVLTLQGKDEGRSAQYKQTADAISQQLPKHVLNDAWARFEQDPEINNVL